MSRYLDEIKMTVFIALFHLVALVLMIFWGELTDYSQYPRPPIWSIAIILLFFAALFVSISASAGKALEIERSREESERHQKKEADQTRAFEQRIHGAVDKWLKDEIDSPWQINFEILEIWSLSPSALTISGISRHSSEEWEPRISNGFFLQLDPATLDIKDAIFVDPGLAAIRGGVMRQVRENDDILVSDIILERFHRDVWFDDGGLAK